MQALSIGVSYDVFWKLTPRKLEPFIEAFKQKSEFEANSFRERTNFAAWLQGIYFAHAIAANFSQNARYFDEPINLNGKENSELQVAKFESWAINYNKNIS